MTDQNLHVVTDHINRLAAMQRTAADKIMGSNRTTADVAGSVLSTHGLVCSATSIALSTAETARKAAGVALYKVSTEFDAKLTTAAINYADADYRSGASIGQACEV